MSSKNANSLQSYQSIMLIIAMVIIAFVIFYQFTGEKELQKSVEKNSSKQLERPRVDNQGDDELKIEISENVDKKVSEDTSNNETVNDGKASLNESAVAENDNSIQKKNEKPIEKVVDEPLKKFVEGADYVTKFPEELSKEPVLIEFFSYMCPHCYNFEPTMKRWIKQKPDSVYLKRVPVSFGRSGSWGLAARSYYIAEELSVVEEFSDAMFKRIHIGKKPPRNLTDLGKVFSQLGIKEKAYKNAANSFNVDSKVRKAEFLVKKYKVTGVPYFLINEKYETGKQSYESEKALFGLWNNLPLRDF